MTRGASLALMGKPRAAGVPAHRTLARPGRPDKNRRNSQQKKKMGPNRKSQSQKVGKNTRSIDGRKLCDSVFQTIRIRSSHMPIRMPADTACAAWRNLIAQPETITSIGMRDRAHVGHPL